MGSSKLLSRLIEELIELERRGAVEPLSEADQQRWRQLCHDLLGVPEELSEKRRYIRVRLSHAAKVLGASADSLPGGARSAVPVGDPAGQDAVDAGVEGGSEADAQVLSLSAGGLFIETDRQLRAGERVAVAVELPQAERIMLTLPGEVRWVCGREDGRHGAGLRFLELDDEQRLVITELVRDELLRDLHLAIEKYRFYFEASPDATLLADRAGQLRELNSRAQRAFGVKREQSIEALVFGLVAESQGPLRTAFEAVKVAVPSEHEATPVERCEVIVAPRGDRPEQQLELLLTPVRAAQIDLGVLIVGRDVTAQRGLERQRRYLEERLRQADKLATLGRIAASVAHDINNPLAWISSNLQLLGSYAEPISALVQRALGSDEPPPELGHLREIDRELVSLLRETSEGGRRLQQIALDLRGLARLEEDEPERLDLNEVIEATLRMLDRQLRGRATVVRELDTELPETCSHFGKLAQIFLNLLTNAERAFDRADARQNVITVRSRYDAESRMIVVAVEDTGAGIPPELSQRIFEPLFSTRQAIGGTGLGLSIARDAARDLGATLSFDSELGRGSSFTLRLPLRRADPKADEATPQVQPGQVTQGRPRLLIVDDEVLMLRSLKRYLKGAFDVVTVDSVQAASVQLAKEPLPEVMLCDVMMPDDGGRAIYRLVTERSPELAERIIFMTGGAFEPEANTFLDELSNRVVSKPIDLPRLVGFLSELASVAAPAKGS
jgi:uncharacterized protein (TIGR02266 family)